MADRREQLGGDPSSVFRLAFQGLQAEMWTALPGAVVAFNTEERPYRIASVQPLIKAGRRNVEEKKMEWFDMPLLLDCPVVFPGGGGYSLTFPLSAGDEGLIVISSRCIDGWWELGGSQPQLELRMHDLSDGFFIPGIESKPNVTPLISPTSVQLRSKDGLTMISMGPESTEIVSPMPINITSTLAINLVAPIITANGVPIP